MTSGKKAVELLSTGFFIGYIPVAPGTFGSLVGLPLGFILAKLNLQIAIIMIVLFILIAIRIATKAELLFDQKDPGCIVIDEMAGMVVTLAGLPFNFLTAAMGFLAFRFFDILKPFPIRPLERKLKGGAGIVLDDIVAGIMANLTLRILLQLINIIH